MLRRGFAGRRMAFPNAGGLFDSRLNVNCSVRMFGNNARNTRVEMTFKSADCSATLSSQALNLSKSSMFRRCNTAAAFATAAPAMNIRHFHTSGTNLVKRSSSGATDRASAIEQAKHVAHRRPDEEKNEEADEEEEQEKEEKEGYLPFPAPFHTINIISVLFTANLILYILMNWVCNDDQREFIVDHFTVSHENWHLVYPLFTSAFYQEHLLQLAIDCYLLYQFGNKILGFMGAGRMLTFWAMCSLGGSLIHVGRQYFEMYYGMDALEVRGRCFGPNPFILGLVAVEGLIFRHLNFMQSPPVPFLVLTAFVMIIDVWRIFTTKPEEHGASTGGALVAYLFWLMPTRFYGLDRLTASM